MTTLRRIATLLILSSVVSGLAISSAFAQPKPGHLDEVLRQMDAASLKFQSTEASFQWDLYEKVVQQTTTQKGTIYFKKEGPVTVMGVKMVSPSLKIIEFKNGLLRLYDPSIDHLTVVDATKNKAQLESFLTVGFGGSGKDLAKAWTISDLGDEIVNGVQTAKLDLVPKDPALRNNCTHMTIWVDPVRGIELKQSLYLPSEDYRTAVYNNIKYNQGVDTKPYQIKTDGKTTTDSH
ncbi:outer membrane lipoprotein-sorting protein [Granulicella sp. S190]|uniref:LolA family protein n=1 Tax=Granulicella sp. S190 TaxID=1747226 RepID=UPI00131B65EE|nr:outer membrane lipoprotein-sorting protein [Granulicella sp. S190]